MSDLRRAIILELSHGALNSHQVAEATGFSPFNVRGELKALKRERLVLELLSTRRHDWELSNRGYELAHQLRQPTIWAL